MFYSMITFFYVSRNSNVLIIVYCIFLACQGPGISVLPFYRFFMLDLFYSFLSKIERLSTKWAKKKLTLTHIPVVGIYLFYQIIMTPFSSVCRFKSQPYLAPSSGISIIWRADNWRPRYAAPQLSALQMMEVPLDGANTADS